MGGHKTMRAAFGQRLTQARLRAGAERGRAFTQTELAQLVGVTPPTISQYEAGASEPDLEMFVRLASALRVPVGTLTFGPDACSVVPDVLPRRGTLTPEEIEAAFEREADRKRREGRAEHDQPRRAAAGGRPGPKRPPKSK
jgi:transcriptional regulator with XRE-family HTH domain